MSIHIIPVENTLTKGENRVLNKLETIYKNIDYDVYIYVTPRVKSLEPDFIVVDKYKGISIIEVKDWSFDYIKNITNKNVITIDNRKHYNPIFRCNQYFNLLNGVFQSNLNLFNDEGKQDYKLYSNVIFSNIKDTEKDVFEDTINQYPTKTIFSNSITDMQIKDIFSDETIALNDNQLLSIRKSISPEIEIFINDEDTKDEELIKALDIEQEKFAKKIPKGHYMVTGVPGSGKTVILIARAIYLLQKNPDWKILIVTYNKSLTSKIQSKIDTLLNELSFSNDNINSLNLEVINFHKLALQNAKIRVPQGANETFWSETLPNNALENAKPQYNLVLIDEYQDFYDNWIKCCINMIIKNDDDSINLFLAGDRLQSIYNSTDINWKQNIGLDMRGRSKLLKSSYRSASSHLDLALHFLKVDEKLEKEVDTFYQGSKDISSQTYQNSQVKFIDGNYDKIVQIIKTLINSKYSYKDIMVLGNSWNEMNNFFYQLPINIKSNAKVGKEIVENKLTITTYHSSKGLENKICFLLDIDKISKRKLVYVGMTRASEHLYIHSKDFSKDSFARDLKSY